MGTALRTTIAAAAAAIITGLLVPAQAAAAQPSDSDSVTSCSTTKRADGRHVTRVRWESGRQVRRVNLTARTRLFPGQRELWSSSWGKPDPQIVSCTALEGGTVLLRTKSRAKYAFVPTAPSTPAPAVVARWQVPVTLSVPGLDASWQAHEAAAAWNAALPAGAQVTVTDVPCIDGQLGCIPVQVDDLAGLHSDEVEPHRDWLGAAWPAHQEGVMQSCRIGLSAEVPVGHRPHTMMHELGHCLGLPHWETEGDQAWTVMSIGISADAVTEWDRGWLAAAYAG